MSTFSDWLARAEARLVSALDLRPWTLPEGLSRVDGRFRDAPVELVARAWRGPRVRFARFVTVSGGGLDIGNLLVLPALDREAPILGADLVDVGRESAVVVADLSPVLEGEARNRQLGAIEASLPPVASDELPAWAERWFSSRALSRRIRAEERTAFETTFARYDAAFAAILRQAPEARGTAGASQADYLRTHREEDRGLALLGRMFGEDAANRLLTQVMFPITLP